MQHGVVFEGRGYDVPLPGSRAYGRGGAYGLVVRLAAAGGEDYLPWLAVQDPGDGLAGALQRLLRLLAKGVQAGGVAVLLPEIRQHGVQGGVAHARGGGVVQIYKHVRPPYR